MIGIAEIWFGLANGQISSNFDGYLPVMPRFSFPDDNLPRFSFPDDNLSKPQGILTKLGTCIDMKGIWFGIANGQISAMFDRVISLRHDNGGVL